MPTEGDRALIERTIGSIPEPDAAAAAAAQAALDAKTKPRGSLGRLEELACHVAAIRGSARPGPLAAAVVVCVADHGIAAEGVSAYPQEVTGQMLRTFAGGEAAICVLARAAGARLIVADLGVREPVRDPAILDRRVRAGTANATAGPAMTRAETERALAIGIELAASLVDDGAGLVALGEMGIANTTAASALAAALLGADPALVCGRGTGLDDAGLERKVAVVRRALAANRLTAGDAIARPAAGCPSTVDPLATLAAVGGLEIAALAGVVLGCAARRTPVLIDGFITATAALSAARIHERCAGTLVASHLSPEPGHRAVLDALGLEPLLDLELRLGEGSGAALALPIVAAALEILSDMATFHGAGVTDAGV